MDRHHVHLGNLDPEGGLHRLLDPRLGGADRDLERIASVLGKHGAFLGNHGAADDVVEAHDAEPSPSAGRLVRGLLLSGPSARRAGTGPCRGGAAAAGSRSLVLVSFIGLILRRGFGRGGRRLNLGGFGLGLSFRFGRLNLGFGFRYRLGLRHGLRFRLDFDRLLDGFGDRLILDGDAFAVDLAPRPDPFGGAHRARRSSRGTGI